MQGTTLNKNSLLTGWPFYVLLLPLFFVLHGINENFGFVSVKDCIPLVLFYWLISVGFFIVFYLVYRNRIKAGFITFFIFFLFFFFGAIQDFLKQHAAYLNRYSILLSSFFAALVIAGYFIKKSRRNFTRLNVYLNCLLLVICAIEIITTGIKKIHPSKRQSTGYQYMACDSCGKPDIYLLVFDEYAASSVLKKYFSYDNMGLDSFLTRRGFHIQTQSFSNYNFTFFSMASMLNMRYIKDLNDNPAGYTTDQYLTSLELIKQNEVTKSLSALDYTIINYSIFDLAGNPALVNDGLFATKTRLITSQTLWGRARYTILLNLFAGKFEIKFLTKNLIYQHLNNNNKILDLVKKETLKKKSNPSFVYAHFMIPHPPYYYDSAGNLKDRTDIVNIKNEKVDYINNVKYTNSVIYDLVNTIQQNTGGKAVILIMGDHGFRYRHILPRRLMYQNQNAIYLPDQNYSLFPDSISGVNQFRVLFNTLFRQNMPLLKDSIFFLGDTR